MIAIAGVLVVIVALIAYLVYNGDKAEYHITTDYSSIEVDGTTQLTMENDDDEPIEKDDKNLKWESDDEDVATVDAYGLVTGVDTGTVEITGTYKKYSAVITITVEEEENLTRVSLKKDSILVGEPTEAVFETKEESISDDEDLEWESSDEKIARVDSSGVVTGVKEGTATIKGTYKEQIASAEITVSKSVSGPGPFPGLEAVDESIINELSDDYNVGPWYSKRTLQGLEWNTDTMDRFYVCNGNLIEAYDADGRNINTSNDVGEARLFSIDYYEGKVFSIMRSSSYGKFKLRVYDAESLELLVSTDLTDIHDQYAMDQRRYNSDLIPAIDGITVAPQFGGGTDLKIYISYNVYYDKKEGYALNEEQLLFEYDYNSIRNSKEIRASATYSVDLGPIKYGIQTLEYDRATGNIWCAVRQGLSNYSLYCLDHNTMKLISNGNQTGWDCSHAGDGFCSLGNDYFYVLVPEYGDDYSAGMIVKVKSEDLEFVG